MAIRYVEDTRIRVTYRDAGGYTCRLTHVAADGTRTRHALTVNPPASGFGPGVAYDSPAAYDAIARSAIAFAADECGDDSVWADSLSRASMFDGRVAMSRGRESAHSVLV